MNLKTIFEIPIYSMSMTDFINRWEKSKKRKYDKCIRSGWSEDAALRFVSNLSYPSWHDSQQIGFIRISVNNREIYFDVFCSLAKGHCFNQNYNHNSRLQINGDHIYVENKSDKYIKKAVLSTLKHIEKNHLQPKFYMDNSLFNNLFEYVNMKKIMVDLNH